MHSILLVVFQQALVLNLVKNFLEIQPYCVPGAPVTPKLAFTPYKCTSFPKAFPFRVGRLALAQKTILSMWSIMLLFIVASTLHVNIWEIAFVVRAVHVALGRRNCPGVPLIQIFLWICDLTKDESQATAFCIIPSIWRVLIVKISYCTRVL